MIFRLFTIITIALLGFNSKAQTLFEDNFETPTLKSSWMGNSDHFLLENGRLRLQAPEGVSESKLWVDFGFQEQTQWNFTLSMDFAPSASNKTEFILAQKTDDKIYLQIGENGSNDGITLIDEIDGNKIEVNESPSNKEEPAKKHPIIERINFLDLDIDEKE